MAVRATEASPLLGASSSSNSSKETLLQQNQFVQPKLAEITQQTQARTVTLTQREVEQINTAHRPYYIKAIGLLALGVIAAVAAIFHPPLITVSVLLLLAALGTAMRGKYVEDTIALDLKQLRGEPDSVKFGC